MAKQTGISWADATFNPWVGCTKVGPGCDHCYAERDMVRRKFVTWGPGEPRRHTSASYWAQPLKWNAEARTANVAFRVFCASLADVFDNEVPEEWRVELFKLIDATPDLTWMLLTKRITNARPYRFPPNVWLGATVVNQEEAERDIAKLLDIPARVRWLSCEPLLGPIDLRGPLATGALHWVIVGGESGPDARLMNAHWAREIRDQCRAARVAFHFKQWGEHSEGGARIGKKAAGHLLDGVEHREFPT